MTLIIAVFPGRALNFYYFTETERGSHYFMGNTANANVCSPLPFLMLAVSSAVTNCCLLGFNGKIGLVNLRESYVRLGREWRVWFGAV